MKSALIKLGLGTLRSRVAASISTFIAVSVGCALVIACGGLLETAIRLDAPPQRFAGAPIIVSGSQGYQLHKSSEVVPYVEQSHISTTLTQTIQKTPGVDHVVLDTSFAAALLKDGQPLSGPTLEGHDWAAAPLTPYELASGHVPTASGQVVLDAATARELGAQTNDMLTIVVNGQPQPFMLVGSATASNTSIPVIFFSHADTQRFITNANEVDAIGVFPSDDADIPSLVQSLKTALPTGTSIATGDSRGKTEFTGVTASRFPLLILSGTFGGLAIVVMGLVVALTIGLSVRQRQPELALLRLTGATPKQVYRLVVVETMAISSLGIIVGAFFGHTLGEWMFSLITTQAIVPAAVAFYSGLIPLAAGIGATLLAASVAASFAGSSASHTTPIQALAEATIPPVQVGAIRRWLALFFAAGTGALAIVPMFLSPDSAAAIGGPAVLTGAIALGLIAPECIYGILSWVGRHVSRRPSTIMTTLAITNGQARASQFAAVLTPLTLAIAIAFGGVYSQTTQDGALASNYAGQFEPDAVVSSSTSGVSNQLLAQIRSTPGVAETSAITTSQGWVEEPYDTSHTSTPWPLLGIDAQGPSPLFTTRVSAGSLQHLTGNTVALPRTLAKKLKLSLGNFITIRLGDGAQERLSLVALLDSVPNYGSIVVPTTLLARHTTLGLPPLMLVRATNKDATAPLVRELAQQAESWPGVSVGDRKFLLTNYEAQVGFESWISYLIAILGMSYAGISSINAIIAIVLARRREMAMQRLNGALKAQVMQMLLIEGTLVVVMSLVLGTIISWFTILPMAVSVRKLPTGPTWVSLAISVAAFVIVWVAYAASGRLALKRKPIEAVDAFSM